MNSLQSLERNGLKISVQSAKMNPFHRNTPHMGSSVLRGNCLLDAIKSCADYYVWLVQRPVNCSYGRRGDEWIMQPRFEKVWIPIGNFCQVAGRVKA